MPKDRSLLDALRPANILKPENRGLLLDLVVFLANLLIMRELSVRFFSLLKKAAADDHWAKVFVFVFFASLCFLAPAGAVLKRWHYHQRLKADRREPANAAAGCLFSPILYFSLSITVFAFVNAFLMEFISGPGELEGHIFVPSIFIGLAMVIVTTVLVYRYFTPPKKEPRTPFMRGPGSAILGDVFIFLNMLFFQLLWNLLISVPFPAVSGAADLAGRLFFITFAALLVYFPPRIFYLAEDINKRRTWLMIFLANSPAIYRIVIGSGSPIGW